MENLIKIFPFISRCKKKTLPLTNLCNRHISPPLLSSPALFFSYLSFGPFFLPFVSCGFPSGKTRWVGHLPARTPDWRQGSDSFSSASSSFHSCASNWFSSDLEPIFNLRCGGFPTRKLELHADEQSRAFVDQLAPCREGEGKCVVFPSEFFFFINQPHLDADTAAWGLGLLLSIFLCTLWVSNLCNYENLLKIDWNFHKY